MKKTKQSTKKTSTTNQKNLKTPYTVQNIHVVPDKIKKKKKTTLKTLEKQWDQSFINHRLPVRIVTYDKPTQYKNLETQFINRYNHDHNFQLTKQRIIKEGDKIAGKVKHWVPEEQWNPSFINHKLYVRPVIFEKQPQTIPYVTKTYGLKFYSVDQKIFKPRSESTHERPPEYAHPILKTNMSDDDNDDEYIQKKMQNLGYRLETDQEQEQRLQNQNQYQQEQQEQEQQQQQEQLEQQNQQQDNQSNQQQQSQNQDQNINQQQQENQENTIQQQKQAKQEDKQIINQEEIEKQQQEELDKEKQLQQEILEQEKQEQQKQQKQEEQNKNILNNDNTSNNQIKIEDTENKQDEQQQEQKSQDN